tara:strand:- start:1694 stop:2326 length:633 start_codon:yes stop_codon:yes gene_type:complete
MQTRTYGDLFKLIQSLAGVGTFAASEKDDIANFINRRFFEAFNTSHIWPRYVVTGEERTIATSPAQTVPYTAASKDNIGEFIRIHRTQPFLRNSALEFDFYVDGNGAHILNLTTADATSAFVTYKKEFTPFTVSSDYENSTVEVPAEFFHFIAHTAYADFLRMDGQTDKALIEEQTGGNYLALELEKIDLRMNNNTVLKKFSTYVNRQAR